MAESAERWRNRAYAGVALVSWLVFVAGLAWLAARLAAPLIPFVLGGALAYLGRPVVAWLEDRGVARGWSVLGLTLVVLAALTAFVVFGAPGILSSLLTFTQTLPAYARDLVAFANAIARRASHLPPQLRSLLLSEAGRAASLLAQSASSVGALVIMAGRLIVIAAGDVFLGFILAIWFLKDGPKLARGLLEMVPERYREDAAKAAHHLDRSFGGFVRGTVVNVSLSFLGCWIGLAVIGVPYAGLLGFLIGAGAVVPFVGPFVFGALAVAVALSQGPLTALLALAVIVAVEQTTDSLISPLVMADAVSLHPVAVLFAIFAGFALGGLLGAIVSIPLLAAGVSLYGYYLGHHP